MSATTTPTADDFRNMLATFSADFDSKVLTWRQAPNSATQQAVKYAFDALTETLKICAIQIQTSKISSSEKTDIMDRIAAIYSSAYRACKQESIEFSGSISTFDYEGEDEDEDESHLYLTEDEENEVLELPPTPPIDPVRLALARLEAAAALDDEDEELEGE